MTEVWESSSTKGGARLVLLALADYANDEGYCHPGVERLALKSALTERNVQFILRDLEARGELVTLQRDGSRACQRLLGAATENHRAFEARGQNGEIFSPFSSARRKGEKWNRKSENKRTNGEICDGKGEAHFTQNRQEPSRTTKNQHLKRRCFGNRSISRFDRRKPILERPEYAAGNNKRAFSTFRAACRQSRLDNLASDKSNS